MLYILFLWLDTLGLVGGLHHSLVPFASFFCHSSILIQATTPVASVTSTSLSFIQVPQMDQAAYFKLRFQYTFLCYHLDTAFLLIPFLERIWPSRQGQSPFQTLCLSVMVCYSLKNSDFLLMALLASSPDGRATRYLALL